MTIAQPAPRVSVVMPTYNQANYLPMALESVLAQTWRDYELIVVNDGSTDDTPRILDDYQARHGFVVIHQLNQKLPSALNTGFRAARGELLTWTSSDNQMLPEMLTELVKALDAAPEVGLVYADWEVIDDDGQFTRTVRTLDFDRHLLMRINFVNACFLYRRACQEAVGLYDPEYLYAEDWEYWLRIAQRFKIQRVPKVLYQYRAHPQSLTATVVAPQAKQRPGKAKLAALLRARKKDWYISKLKWEWLCFRRGSDPRHDLEAAHLNLPPRSPQPS